MSHSSETYSELADLLVALQIAMQEAQIWETPQPSASAMASVQPFCLDTMRFEQWLRYVLVARFNTIIEQRLSLPERCQIAPMIEQALPDIESSKVKPLMHVTDALDRFLTRVALV